MGLGRLDGAERLAGIDLARGLAVLGMLAAHLLTLPEWIPEQPDTWLGIVHGRSSILFATLAGVSIGLVSGGRTPVAGNALRVARRRLALRAAVLWMLGLALVATGVPVYVILPAYAVLFLLALPFLPLRARALLPVAAALALVMPVAWAMVARLPLWGSAGGEMLETALGLWYPFPVWIAYVLTGLGIARLGLERMRVQALLVGIGCALAALGYGMDALVRGIRPPVAVAADDASGGAWEAVVPDVWTAAAHSNGILGAVGSGGFAVAVIGVCLLICRTPARWVALPLRAVGSMPLSAYAGQLVAWAVWAAIVLGDTGDLEDFRALDPFPAFALVTIVACTAWALLIGRGPLEAGMDRLARVVVPRR